MENSAKSAAVTAAIVALLLGGGAGYAIGMNKDDNKSDSQSSQSASADSGMSADGVTVGGAKMVRNLDIVDNAANAKNVTTVVDLVKQAGLVDTLKSEGPFTVFGPNNDAFGAVPKNILDKVAGDVTLLKTVLTYHVVPGTYTSADLRVMASKGETLKSVQGGVLTPIIEGGEVKLKDAAGQMISIETPDIISSNGVTHVIKSVMLPVDPSTL